MNALAAIRPDEWNMPLFIRILGALVLTGALALTTAYLFSAWRTGSAPNLRMALRSLTLGVFPAWIVLRGGAEWISDRRATPTSTARLDRHRLHGHRSGLPADRDFERPRLRGDARTRAGGEGPKTSIKVAAVLIALLLVLNVVAIWAMTTKPG